MLAGGAVVWAVRIVGWAALRKEAMGFGDVTLLAMIGAFLGWQAALVVFFIAPFFAIAVGIMQVVIHRDQRIPFGPHLCSAAAVMVLFWGHFWNEIAPIFSLGLWVPLVVAACVALMGAILAVYRAIIDRLVGRGSTA
jgi:prepilin signal peptidase PulO-like enzyme (type II secretory pathway)